MKDPSAGPKGGYIVTRDCDECGEVASSYEISLNVPSDFVLTHIENNWGYLAFKFDVNEATAGTYRFFSTSGVDFDAALGYSTWGDQIDGYLVSDSSIGDFSLTVALTAGSTYGLEVRMYGYADAVITMQRID